CADEAPHAESPSRAAVERDRDEMRQRFNECRQVVAGMVADPAVQASLALRLRDDVPETDAMTQQRLQTREVIEAVHLLANHVADQMPEAVLLVRIVLRLRKRDF